MQRLEPRLVRILARAAGAALLLGCLATGASAQQQDRLVLKNGKDRSVRIKTEDVDGVWYTSGTATTLVRWDEIESVEYGAAEPYLAALDHFRAGRISEAAAAFEALAGDAQLRPVLQQNVLYYLGLANEQLGKPDQALTHYKGLLTTFPKSRYILPVGSHVLNLYLARNDAAAAARDLEPVLALAKESDKNPELQASIWVLHGRLQEEQKKFDEAETLYGNVVKAKVAPDVIATAKLGLGRTAQKRQKSSDAEKLFRELSKSDAPSAVLAGAWNGLGDMSFEQASGARDPDGLRVALLAYLRGVVLYMPARGEPTEELERSLAGASRAFKAIGELEGNAERKKLFLDRARQRRDQLANQYPSSRFLVGL